MSTTATATATATATVTADSRALHWVLKVGNLRDSLAFFEEVLGLRVLRHEEFSSGCEATCNGPYGGAWSKTMIGYGPEDRHFALELTYNYGISSYTLGNDLQYISVACPVALKRAKLAGYAVDGNVIIGPDNYRYNILPCIAGREERFVAVGLRVSNLERSLGYWRDVLKLAVFPTPAGLNTSCPSACVGFTSEQTHLQLIEVQDGVAVDHALSSGRIAFACKAVPPIFEAVKAANEVVQVPPLTLPTPGKADVVVTILNDRDGYEICFVEDAAFYDLATPKYDVVDFVARAALGGDGAPPPAATAVEHSHNITPLSDVDEANSILSSESGLVVFDFSAGWCKNCQRIAPHISSLASKFGSEVVYLH
jgi:catechol 2,3-dioxygenase-like lactoylglutathione lyase family enzyme